MSPADRQLGSALGRRAPLERPALSPERLAALRRQAYAAGIALVDLGALGRSDPGLEMRVREWVTRQMEARR